MSQGVFSDLRGVKFGLLTPLESFSKNKQTYWICLCDCGNTKIVRRDSLENKLVASCGCDKNKPEKPIKPSHSRKSQLKDLTGVRFGSLVAKKGETIDGKGRWECLCDCGNTITVWTNSLTSGNTRSCGCLRTKANTRHGKRYSRVYSSWRNMLKRCYAKNHNRYEYYGARGITVCDRWRESFENFFSDMGEPPTDEHSIDRINNDGNYEPGNCRWATPVEQNNNQRRRRSHR